MSHRIRLTEEPHGLTRTFHVPHCSCGWEGVAQYSSIGAWAAWNEHTNATEEAERLHGFLQDS